MESSELRDDGLSFDIHDDGNRPVHFRLTLTSGVLGGEATVGTEIWKVAVVPVGGGGGDRIPIPVSGSGVGVGSGLGGGVESGNSRGVGPGPHRVGVGVSAPVLIHKVEPEYSEEARKANTKEPSCFTLRLVLKGSPRISGCNEVSAWV